MTVENISFDSRPGTDPAVTDVFLPFPVPDLSYRNTTSGLSGHVRRMQKNNQGISRWLIIAVAGGAVVAFAMVQYAIH